MYFQVSFILPMLLGYPSHFIYIVSYISFIRVPAAKSHPHQFFLDEIFSSPYCRAMKHCVKSVRI